MNTDHVKQTIIKSRNYNPEGKKYNKKNDVKYTLKKYFHGHSLGNFL